MTTTPSTLTFRRPAWATDTDEHIDGTVSFIRNCGIEVVDAAGRRPHVFSLEQMIGLDLLDGGEVRVHTLDGKPVIAFDQMQLDPDGARQLIAALTELVDAYDAAQTSACECGDSLCDAHEVGGHQTYATLADAVTREVVPALGDHVGDFDVEAIARELFEWHTERTEQGDILVNRSGYRMRADIEFWTVAGGYERTDATETP